MNSFSFFRRESLSGKLAKDLGPLLVRVAVHECGTLQQVWKRGIDDETQVALFAEFIIVLIAVADRLAFQKFGDPIRSQVMNPVVDTARDCFANQQYFGSTPRERERRFEELLAERFQKFASCSSIMGEGMNSLVFTCSRHLAETFLDDIPESELPNAVVETDKAVSSAIVALMTVPTFKALLEE